ncbi:hypothetical protein BO82DRAFT_351235 [Aspergillus uvarum CBS 121591]|uniref:Uncharacterized protein n=1 Tax=Aspergillus uvarum CBS 121591 TaxID=1448315 RepID=A0A319DBE8_9EURO|nr:hypothetical protein BO82DRAFT_351235 [Aspergillus uvarum CBS 121591]PYH85398.1 hypothetical protein BO82DRAFT_351235 [Aspergillus uvarum CBS 121591]
MRGRTWCGGLVPFVALGSRGRGGWPGPTYLARSHSTSPIILHPFAVGREKGRGPAIAQLACAGTTSLQGSNDHTVS